MATVKITVRISSSVKARISRFLIVAMRITRRGNFGYPPVATVLDCLKPMTLRSMAQVVLGDLSAFTSP